MKIKICGITNIEDARHAYEAGAYALGFIFCKKSPRYIDPELAKSIISKMKGKITTVGVFANQSVDEINKITGYTDIDMIQLYGKESSNQGLIHIPIIRVLEVCENSFILDVDRLKKYSAVMVDLPKSCLEEKSVVAQSDVWKLASKLAKNLDVYLAGNISIKNIESAVNSVEPYAIDICSSVEISPGLKNTMKVNQLFEFVNRRKL